jgi:cytochrome c-type biogenesis protein CcmH
MTRRRAVALLAAVAGSWLGQPALLSAHFQDDPAADTPQAEQATAQPAGGELSDAELENLTAIVADELRCLVCRNQSVLESNSELAREMQQLIRERLLSGESPDEVREYFLSRYGDYILLKPRARGAAILVYALPVLAFLLGGLLLFGKLRKWSRRGAEEADSTEPLDADPAAPGSADEAGDVSAADEEWLQKALAEE